MVADRASGGTPKPASDGSNPAFPPVAPILLVFLLIKQQKPPDGFIPGAGMQFFLLKPQDNVAEMQACRPSRIAVSQPDER